MEKRRINISVNHKKDLAQEFEVSYQSIQMSLDYVFNSKKAKRIRQRAKEMLQEEINKIDIEETK